jgi:hypothetical protein
MIIIGYCAGAEPLSASCVDSNNDLISSGKLGVMGLLYTQQPVFVLMEAKAKRFRSFTLRIDVRSNSF